jgi:hypothetical protein
LDLTITSLCPLQSDSSTLTIGNPMPESTLSGSLDLASGKQTVRHVETYRKTDRRTARQTDFEIFASTVLFRQAIRQPAGLADRQQA